MNHTLPPVGGGADPDARLRAADPAAGVEPDLTALRAAVRERADAGRVDELAAARSRRWAGWPARAFAGAAAALLVGAGGGYAVGASGGGTSGGGAEPAIALSGPAADAEAGAEAAITEESASGELESQLESVSPQSLDAPAPTGLQSGPMPASALRESSDMAWGYGRTVFTSSGLSSSGGSAAAWAFDPSAAFTAETARSAATALGVDGEPALTDGAWTVGPVDGSGANLQIHPDGLASLSFYDPEADPWHCPAPETMDDASAEGPVEDPCVQREIGTAPDTEAAVAEVREVLAAVGLDPDSFEYESPADVDDLWTSVTAHHVVDGQRTGAQWWASFTGAGVQSIGGGTAPVVALGEYAVVSPAQAVERLMDPRFGAGGGPVAFVDGGGGRMVDDPAVSGPAPERTVPPTPQAGDDIAWPVAEVTIVGSRLGVALHTQPDGATTLLPSYELTSDGGAIWSVVAVADDHLDTAGR